MKNKFFFFKIIILIFFIFIGNVKASEQFNFDVTEVEITENGNIFKGLKRGKATSDNGIIIEADNFHYNKELNILNAQGDVKIKDTIKNYDIFSEKITYLKDQEKIFTNGKTIAIIEKNYHFETKNAIFLRNEMNLSSSEKSILKDGDSNLYKFDKFNYSLNETLLKANKVQIITNFNKKNNEKSFYNFDKGIFNIKTKDFIAGETKIRAKKNIFDISKNDPRLYGVSSKKEDHLTTLNKGVFTSCALNDSCPPWSISSEKILHDSNKKQIIYKNALLKIYDFPVLYFPKFFHPDPSVKRQSGFLQPRLNDSNVLGSSFNLPYFHVISENKDLTFSPTIFDKDIYMMQNEYRQKNKSSSFITDFSFAKGYKSIITDNKKKNLGHLFAKLNMNLDYEYFEKSDLKLSLEQVTNDTYLKVFESNLINTDEKFKPLNKGQLTSSIDLNLDHKDFSLDTGMTAYETLEGSDSDRYQYVLPYYNLSKNLISNSLLSLDLISNGSNNYQNTNNIKSEIINNFNLETSDFFSDNGLKNNFGIYFKNLNTVAKKDTRYKSSPQIELMSILNFESSLPLVKDDTKYLNSIIPKLSFRINPTEMRNYSEIDRQINTDNIFSINRLSISDSYEDGKSLTLGLDYKKQSLKDINKYFDLNLATILRDTKQDKIPIKSTIGERQSNLFGSTKYGLSEIISLDYNFAVDNDMKTFEYNSLNANFDFNYFNTNFNYVETSGKMGDTNYIENSSTINFNEDNYLTFKTRRNRKISLTEYYDLVYEYKNDCLTAGIKYKKTYYQDRDLKPAEDMLFTISLFPLTQYEQKIDQDLYRN